MPEFKKEGRGFKMKGWSPFTKDDEYTPQTTTRRDIDTDITPQSIPEMSGHIEHKTGVKKEKKKINVKKMMTQGLANVVLGPTYQIGKALYNLHKKKKS